MMIETFTPASLIKDTKASSIATQFLNTGILNQQDYSSKSYARNQMTIGYLS
jgi:hypothetical protein